MGVEPSASDLVAPGFGDVPHAEAREHRADEHDRTAQTGASFAVVFGADVVEVDLPGPEGIGVVGELFDLDAHAAQELDELHDIEDLGDVAYDDPFGCQQRGAEDLQSFVLGSLRGDRAVEAVAAFDFEYGHLRGVFLWMNAGEKRGCGGVRGRVACNAGVRCPFYKVNRNSDFFPVF